MRDKNRPWRIGLGIGLSACAMAAVWFATKPIDYVISASITLLVAVILLNEGRIERITQIIEQKEE